MCECVHVRACVGVWTLVHHGGRGIRTGRVRRGGKLCWEGRAGARLQEYALFASHARLCPVIGLSREPWGTVPERSSGRLEAGTLPTWVPAPAPPPPHRRGIGLSKGPGGPTAPWPPRQLPCSPPITPQLALCGTVGWVGPSSARVSRCTICRRHEGNGPHRLRRIPRLSLSEDAAYGLVLRTCYTVPKPRWEEETTARDRPPSPGSPQEGQ